MLMDRTIDNPMVSGYGFREPNPDIVCKHCGCEWYEVDLDRFEGSRVTTRDPLSQSRMFCAECIMGKSTDETLDQWAREEADPGEIVLFAIGGHGYASDREAARLFLDALKEHATDVYVEILHGYMQEKEEDSYIRWLMDKF